MRKFVTLSLAAAALVGAGGVAYAQAGEGPALTRAQVEQRSAEAFALMDANKDGVLDRTDRDARRQERFARRDANGDGEVSPADREARRKAAFERLDADDDGALSLAEFSARAEQRDERRADRRGPGRRGAARLGRDADTNRDGTVTQAEFASAALARFDRVDVDKDGTISANERPARRERRQRNAG
jgi:Ca2+-binding EF-hand superfamily protein